MTSTRMDSDEKKESPPTTEEQEAAFAGTFFEAILGAQLIQTAYIGHKLGWYAALKEAGEEGLTPEELSLKTDSSERYAREWLEQQAVAGWIRCDNPSAGANFRRFVIPKAHASVLANPDSLSYMVPLAILQGGTSKRLDSLVKAYKNDTGVSWDEIGDDAREAQSAMNRPFFLQGLASTLEECLEDKTIHKLQTGGGRVADIGCGYANSSIGVAKYFPSCHVDAYDLDKPSIERAKENIMKEGLEERVQAHCVDAASVMTTENFQPYDLVMALECVHDLSDPISVLRTMRELAADSGTVIVMDERVAEDFESGIANPVEQAMYGFSCTCCLADGMSSKPSAATGTVMRPKLLRAYAQQAGFRDIEIMPVENDFFRFYKLVY